MKKIICSLIFVGFLQFINACTDVTIKAQDGSVVAGRSMEWEFPMGWRLVGIPAGSKLKLYAPSKLNLPEHTITTKYGIVGFDSEIMPGSIVDGQNTEGVGFSANFLPQFTEYQQVTKNDKYYSSLLTITQLVLGTAKNVEEAKQIFSQYKVWNEVVPNAPTSLTLHVLVTDKTGKSIVVEYIKGEVKIYDNSIGILTNAPEYPWHLYNLTNYLHLNNQDVTSNVDPSIGAIKTQFGSISQTSQGVGFVGLPGDFTSPSRFVRTTALWSYAIPAKNNSEAVQLAAHILNNVDVVKGSIKTVVTLKEHAYEYTQWLSLKDLSNNKLYFSDYDHRTNFISIDINKLLSQNKQVAMPIDKINYPDNDITNQFK